MNTQPKQITELYFSVDIEADGSIPSLYSMNALGASIASYLTADGELVKLDPATPENRFYAELRPISEDFVADAIAVGKIDGWDDSIDDPTGAKKHQYLMENGEAPELAMERFTAWVRERQEAFGGAAAIFVGFPVVYDWMWVYWYMMAFTKDGSPFGHGRALDIKTAYKIKSGEAGVRSVKRRMPKFLHSKLRHTHRADDDAAEQGELFTNILRWDGNRGPKENLEIAADNLAGEIIADLDASPTRAAAIAAQQKTKKRIHDFLNGRK